MTERDNHFQEYANLVYIRMLDANLVHLSVDGMTTPSIEIEEAVTEMREKIIRLIAECAYDFAEFACMAIAEKQMMRGSRLSPHAMLPAIPDMREWPKHEQE